MCLLREFDKLVHGGHNAMRVDLQIQLCYCADSSDRTPSNQLYQLIEQHLHKNSVECGIMFPIHILLSVYLIH